MRISKRDRNTKICTETKCTNKYCPNYSPKANSKAFLFSSCPYHPAYRAKYYPEQAKTA